MKELLFTLKDRKNRSSIIRRINLLKRSGRKIVFTNGCFDLLHSGHVAYLEKARSLGDVLVVGLNSDQSVRSLNKGENRPIIGMNERKRLLEALRAVDVVIPFSASTPLGLIRLVKPDVLVKGGDWKKNQIVGADFVESYGGRVVSGIFIKGRSTSEIIAYIKNHG